MFVVMALVTTFITTPLVSFLFPPWYQKKLAAWKRGEIDWEGRSLTKDITSDDSSITRKEVYSSHLRNVLVCLGLESLPSIFTFVSLLGYETSTSPSAVSHPGQDEDKSEETHEAPTQETLEQRQSLELHGLRLLELSERLSSVMQESEVDEWGATDPVVNAFHTFGQLNNASVSGEVQFVAEGGFADVVNDRALQHSSELILLPWSKKGSISEVTALAAPDDALHNAFTDRSYNLLINQLLETAPCDTAVFINNGFGGPPREDRRSLGRMTSNVSRRSMSISNATAPITKRGHHIFLPYFGGRDDPAALAFVLKLAQNPSVTATVLLIEQHLDDDAADSLCSSAIADVKTNTATSQTPVQASPDALAHYHSTRDSLPQNLRNRVLFETLQSNNPLSDVASRAEETSRSFRRAGDLIVVGRNASAPAV